MRVKKTLLTAEDLLHLPDTGCCLELVEGELLEMPPAGGMHGKATIRIGGLLDSYALDKGLGHTFGAETGFVLGRDPDTVMAPDAAFISYERLPPDAVTPRFPELAPDLVVEVVSPNDPAREVHEKARVWLAAGTSEVWVISPQHRTVTVHRPDALETVIGESASLTGGMILPEFEVPVARLFI